VELPFFCCDMLLGRVGVKLWHVEAIR
jgi:hypothetical protein